MSVTAANGFRASGVVAGLKSSGKPDLALVVNDGPSFAAAAVFTSNRVQAAPVVWSRQVVGDGRIDAVVLNSGGANACTGPAAMPRGPWVKPNCSTSSAPASTPATRRFQPSVCSTAFAIWRASRLVN